MKILVTGASGFVGNNLVKSLKLKGLEIVSVNRKSSISLANDLHVVTDFCNFESLKKPLVDCDVVIHLAGRAHVMNETFDNPLAEFRKANVDSTIALAKEALLAGVKRFIYISSIGVNGDKSDLPFTEDLNTKPHNAYSISKFEAEQALRSFEGEMQIVIIRPPLIYGDGVKANFKNLIKLCNKHMPLPFGAINNKRSLIYIENLIDFIALCTHHPNASNQTFLVSDGDDVSTTALIKTIKKSLNKPNLLIPIPKGIVVGILNLLGKSNLAIRLCGDLQIDISKAKTLLGWNPPYSFEYGIKKTVEAFQKNH